MPRGIHSGDRGNFYIGTVRATLCLLALSMPPLVQAGGDPIPVGARQAGMGYANLTLIDLWCTRANQAGLAGLEHTVVGAFHQQHWLAAELSMQGAAFATPLGKGTIAASVSSFGFELYRQQGAGLAYAMRLGEGLRAGVQLDHVSVRLGEGYGSHNALVAQIGVQARLSDALWVGAHLYNPSRSELGGRYEERIPTVLRAGMGYTFSEQLLMTFAIEKDVDLDERVSAGIEYHPMKALFLRTGVATGPVIGTFGAGVRTGRIDIDLAVAVRSRLGPTPQLGINYRFE